MQRYSRPHHKVNTESAIEHARVIAVGLGNLELRNVEAGEGEPERAVRGEGSGTKRVTAGPLFNARNDLGETTVAEGEAKDDIRVGDTADPQVEERKYESGAGEADDGQWRTLVEEQAKCLETPTQEDQEEQGWRTCGGRRGRRAGWCPWGFRRG